jgi:hypothetical protein
MDELLEFDRASAVVSARRAREAFLPAIPEPLMSQRTSDQSRPAAATVGPERAIGTGSSPVPVKESSKARLVQDFT